MSDKNIDIFGAMPYKTERLFDLIAQGNELENFALVGGTALSLYLKHRTSEDLDFFTNRVALDGHLKGKISELISRLRKNGIVCYERNHDDYDICYDYMFGDVKVTFLASDIKLLDSVNKYKNLNIASIEQISAMKMYTILNYRIKTRDFYDIKSLIVDGGYSFENLLDFMRERYPRTGFSESTIEKRFCGTPLKKTDEGLGNLDTKYSETFESLRLFLKKEINKIIDHQSNIGSLSDEELMSFCNKRVGLLREIGLTKLYRYGMSYKIFSLDLGKYCGDIGAEDINGNTLFHKLGKDNKMLEYLLFNMNELPSAIKPVLEYEKNAEGLLLLEKHRLLNRCLDKSDDRVEKILEGKNIDREKFFNELHKKRERFGFSSGSTVFKNILDKKKEENFAKINYN